MNQPSLTRDRAVSLRVDLTTFRLFTAVAEEKSIARAAARENIAPSAVSKRILCLETDLQTSLFRRHQRGVDLTDAGRVLFQHTRSLFSILDRMRGELSEFASGGRGHVLLAANPSSVVEFLPQDLQAFLARYPNINVGLEERFSTVAGRLVREGVVDLGIVASEDAAEELELLPYRMNRLAVVVAQSHPLARHLSVAFEDTLEYDHIGLQEEVAVRALLVRAAQQAGRPLEFKVNVASFDGVRRFVQAGVGISVLPEACIKPYEKLLGLRAVRLSNSWAMRSLHICARDFANLSVAARLLVAHLVEAEPTIAAAS